MPKSLNNFMFTFMASVAHHLLSLFLFTSILYTSINGESVKPSIPACPSFDCGNGLTIGYPFWQKGQQKDQHCGYPGFGLSCTGQQPFLRLSDDLYGLKTLNYSENTLTVTYAEVKNGTCPIAPHDVKLNTSSFFNYTIEDQIVKFFYNCTLYPPSLPSIACLRHGSKRSYVFMEGAIPEFDWLRYCESMVISVLAVEKGVDGHLVNGFGRVLQDGFKLTWRSPDIACRSCEATGGFCGYSNGLHRKFICFCSDGRESGNCHDDGVVKVAFESNFVATGALICGGLVIASTAFYFIQKKKFSLQKPAFSRIPSSGK